jgi:hypothetical protein
MTSPVPPKDLLMCHLNFSLQKNPHLNIFNFLNMRFNTEVPVPGTYNQPKCQFQWSSVSAVIRSSPIDYANASTVYTVYLDSDS